ncbi:MAG: zinc-ribbon domain-containing protein [Steroidobacteraceae bacterium]|nr:zinc-ribbon domain-containing protein [Deltaproteobacteria bacterium]
MSMLTITCPSCGISRQVPADRVPDGPRRVTCPQCKNVFPFTKPAAIAPSSGETPPMSPVPPLQIPQPPRPSSAASNSHSRPPVKTTVPPKPRPAPPRGLTDIGDLFIESWQQFQRRFATLFGLYLLTMAAFILPMGVTIGLAMFAGMSKGGIAFVLTGTVGLLAGLYLGFRCLAAFLHAVVDDQLAFKEALGKGGLIIIPLMWTGFLTGFIISGGFMLFIIPGIIFMVWFFFAQFILIKEDVHGMNALLKSREYVRGEWFNVALRLLLIWAASILVGAIPLAGPILYIVFFPFVMIFHYLIYRDLREMKGDVPFSCGAADILKWPAVSLAGFIIVPLALVSLAGFSLYSTFARFAPTGTKIVQKSAPVNTSGSDNQGLRVITFPQQGGSSTPTIPTTPADPAANASATPPGSLSATTLSGSEEYPDKVHVFIYAVNYTGTVRANGTTIKEMEGKPDMQYNYNMDGRSLRYGQNQIEVEYAELPNPPSTMLGVHIKVSRRSGDKGSEILGDWRFNDKGTGKKTFNFDIQK